MMIPKLDLNVTNKCNFRCVHCAFDSGCKKMPEMKLLDIKKILKDTKLCGGKKIDITGGEPTTRKDLSQIIKTAKRLGFKIELVTNGSLLTDAKLRNYKKIGLDTIAISLDGSDYETYSKIRLVTKKIHNKVILNIKKATKYFPVKINTIVSTVNLSDIPNITQFCIKHKIAEHGLYYFTPIGRGNSSDKLTVEPIRWLKFIKHRLLRYEKKIKISLEVLLAKKGKIKKEIRCLADSEQNHLQILPDLKTYPCAIMSYHNLEIANLSNEKVTSVINNKKRWNNYWETAKNKFKYNYCVNFSTLNLNKYDNKKYDLVCPLRKYAPSEVV